MINKPFLVAVDVRSAHNVGSLFRTCDGLGADLALVGITPRPGYDDDDRLPHIVKRAEKEIAKTALGAEESVSWRYFDTLLEAKHHLENLGYTLIAIEQDDRSRSIRDLTPRGNVALVVGPEVDGLSPVKIKLCDSVYDIPMKGQKESLNVSVAAAIALFQATS